MPSPPGGLATPSRLLEPPFWFTKILFLEYHVTTRKPTMTQKGIITFNPTYLTKVAYISSMLKFLNTESLMVKFQTIALTYKFYTSERIRSSSIFRLDISISKPRAFASYALQSILSPKPVFLKPWVGMHNRRLSVKK